MPGRTGRFDYDLVRDGGIKLYFKERVLDEALVELSGLGYQVIELPTNSLEAFQQAFSTSPLWAGYNYVWTDNLNALDDGLCDIAWPENNRLVVSIRGFQKLWSFDKVLAHGIVDVFARHCREELMFGRLLLLLLQTNNPQFVMSPIGSFDVRWNEREWLDKKRGL